MSGLTVDSAQAIADFIPSPRCRLNTLALNGNSLGYDGVVVIINAMRRNYTLHKLDIFANIDGDHDEQALHAEKKSLEARNARLQHTVANEALILLRCSRVLLLHGSRLDADASTSLPVAPTFIGLPTELKQHILTFIAPHLSTPQCLRVLNFASSTSTLPQLAVMPGVGCLPDPSAFPFGLSNGPRSPCENGACMGAANSLLCKRENRRADWLTTVGCEVPDHDIVELADMTSKFA